MKTKSKLILLISLLVLVRILVHAINERTISSFNIELLKSDPKKNNQFPIDSLRRFADNQSSSSLNSDLLIAKRCYNNILHLYPNDPASIAQLDKIDKRINLIETDRYHYGNLLRKADLRFDTLAFKSAQSSYQRAATIRPNDSYPKKMSQLISLIDTLNPESSLNCIFDSLIQCGYRQFQILEFEKSKLFFERAHQLKPEEYYPICKLSELNHIINTEIVLDSTYNFQLDKVDSIFKSGDYTTARHLYLTTITPPNNSIYTKVMAYTCDAIIMQK